MQDQGAEGSARDPGSLGRDIRRCRACSLAETRTHAVPGEGAFRLRVLLVGEAPGEAEDRLGRPFVGRTGRFLDGFLEEAGFSRDDFFITSSVKCRPPGNRDPRRSELETCRERWLLAQIEALDPRLVVLLGRIPAMQNLGLRGRLADLRGELRRRNDRDFLVTCHPTAAMRFPKQRAAMREDFGTLRRLLDS